MIFFPSAPNNFQGFVFNFSFNFLGKIPSSTFGRHIKVHVAATGGRRRRLPQPGAYPPPAPEQL
eukprot:1047830-Prorocentrum_minimum.AAC.1